jgi:hypothetical protein
MSARLHNETEDIGGPRINGSVRRAILEMVTPTAVKSGGYHSPV